jgi:hypothetical protein
MPAMPAMPAIDGVRVEDCLLEYDEIGQMQFDAHELGEIEFSVHVQSRLQEQGRILRQYRFHLNAKRRELVRDRMLSLIAEIDEMGTLWRT